MDLTGIWIGETINGETPTHHWIIVQNHLSLDIYTRWHEEESFPVRGQFKAIMREDNLFKIYVPSDNGYGLILNEHSFKMIQWVFDWQDGKFIPMHDVLFQRYDGGLQQFEIEFLIELYEDKSVVKRFNDLPYA